MCPWLQAQCLIYLLTAEGEDFNMTLDFSFSDLRFWSVNDHGRRSRVGCVKKGKKVRSKGERQKNSGFAQFVTLVRHSCGALELGKSGSGLR